MILIINGDEYSVFRSDERQMIVDAMNEHELLPPLSDDERLPSTATTEQRIAANLARSPLSTTLFEIESYRWTPHYGRVVGLYKEVFIVSIDTNRQTERHNLRCQFPSS